MILVGALLALAAYAAILYGVHLLFTRVERRKSDARSILRQRTNKHILRRGLPL